MLIDLLERGDVAVTAIPVDQERADAGSSSPGHVLLRRIADMERLARLASRQLQRTFEDRGIRLAGARLGGGDRPVQQLAEPAAIEHPRERAVPVRHGDQTEAAVAEPAQRRDRIRVGGEADRGDELVDTDAQAELAGDQVRAALPEL